MSGPIAIQTKGPLVGATVAFSRGGMRYVTAVIKATFAMIHEGHAVLVAPLAVQTSDASVLGLGTLERASELSPFVPQVDVTVRGHARAPGGELAPAVAVRLVIFRERPLLDKTLYVYGDRESDSAYPRDFAAIPLVYELARASAHNPLGLSDDDVPNIVLPKDKRGTPGFAPIPPGWPSRQRLAGGERMAVVDGVLELSEDFPFSFFQASPSDQRLDVLRGDEWIFLDGMHPELARVATKLPGAVVRAEMRKRGGRASQFDLSCDTVSIDADDRTISLVWRGHLPLPSDAGDGYSVVASIELASTVDGFDARESTGKMLALSSFHDPSSHAGGSLPSDEATPNLAADEPMHQGRGGAVASRTDPPPASPGAFEHMPFAKPPLAPVFGRPPSVTPAPSAEPNPRASQGLPFWTPSTSSALSSDPSTADIPIARGARATDQMTVLEAPPTPSWQDHDTPREGVAERTTSAGAPPASETSAGAFGQHQEANPGSGTLPPPPMPPSLRQSSPPPPSLRQPPLLPPDLRTDPSSRVPIDGSGSSRPAPLQAGIEASGAPAPLGLGPRSQEPSSSVGSKPPDEVHSSTVERSEGGAPASVTQVPMRIGSMTLSRGGGDPTGPALSAAEPAPAEISPRAAPPPAEPSRAAAPGEPEEPAALEEVSPAEPVPPPRLRLTSMHGAAEAVADAPTEATGSPATAPGAASTESPTPLALKESAPAIEETGVRGVVVAKLQRREAFYDANYSGTDLSGIDFTEAVLSGINLSGAKLSGCCFKGARLTGAKLMGADLRDATLIGADLGQADLSRALLDRARFDDAILTDSNLTLSVAPAATFDGATATRAAFAQGQWEGSSFRRATLTSTDFSGSDISRADFEGAQLPSARFSDARGVDAKFVGSDLDQATFTGASLRGASFDGASMKSSSWERAALEGCSFRGAKMERAIIARATIGKAIFADAELEGANFVGAMGDGVDFSGAKLIAADLRQTKLGDVGFERADLTKVNAHKAVLASPRFSDANLSGASFRAAKMRGADFSGAELFEADLRDADLENAKLNGAKNRAQAKLGGANLRGAEDDEKTSGGD